MEKFQVLEDPDFAITESLKVLVDFKNGELVTNDSSKSNIQVIGQTSEQQLFVDSPFNSSEKCLQLDGLNNIVVLDAINSNSFAATEFTSVIKMSFDNFDEDFYWGDYNQPSNTTPNCKWVAFYNKTNRVLSIYYYGVDYGTYVMFQSNLSLDLSTNTEYKIKIASKVNEKICKVFINDLEISMDKTLDTATTLQSGNHSIYLGGYYWYNVGYDEYSPTAKIYKFAYYTDYLI